MYPKTPKLKVTPTFNTTLYYIPCIIYLLTLIDTFYDNVTVQIPYLTIP